MKRKEYRTLYGKIVYWVSRAGEDRPWLVFLPGLTADHRLFGRQIAAFRERYNCLVWDAPAHGQSRPFALKFTMDDLAEYLHGIFREEKIQKPVLTGQSLGGYIAQVYMELYPDDVSAFISIDSCPLHRSYYTKAELFLLKHTKGMYLAIPWKWLLCWGTAGTARTEYGRRLMRRMMMDYEKEAYCTLADYGYRIFAEAVETGRSYQIPCPALVLCGQKDRAGSARRYNARWEKRERGKITFCWVADAGHNANTDRPDTVNGEIEKFVRRIQNG